VIDSRPSEDFSAIRRRRECLECRQRFTTYERIETVPLLVAKKNGAREAFDRRKLLGGIVKACEKQPVALEAMEKMAFDIEAEILESSLREVESRDLGEAVMEQLKRVDEVAYVRFASVYRSFKDIDTFMAELLKIKNEIEHSEK
jgi:transcriptional repressor NrdR